MKKILVTSATVLCIGLTALAQKDSSFNKNGSSAGLSEFRMPSELSFDMKPRSIRPITKEKLESAKVLSDFIIGFPTNWIINYKLTEIEATCNGKIMKAMGTNEVLTKEQKNILNSVDEGTGIIIHVKYKDKNAVTGKDVNNEMNVKMMILPEKEAEFAGGKQQMNNYLKENVITKMDGPTRRLFENTLATVVFTVNEKGEIINAKLSQPCGDIKTDKLILNAITKMPKWKPAENSKGINVNQEFEFRVGNGGC
jgi:TonB family protein